MTTSCCYHCYYQGRVQHKKQGLYKVLPQHKTRKPKLLNIQTKQTTNKIHKLATLNIKFRQGFSK